MNFFPLVFGCMFVTLGGFVYFLFQQDCISAILCGLGAISYLLVILDRYL